MNNYIKQSFLEDGFSESEINDWMLDDEHNTDKETNYEYVNDWD